MVTEQIRGVNQLTGKIHSKETSNQIRDKSYRSSLMLFFGGIWKNENKLAKFAFYSPSLPLRCLDICFLSPSQQFSSHVGMLGV